VSEKLITIGVLYPGEMGSRLGEMLRTLGHRVISVVVGRSRRTRGLCREAGIETVDSVRELARLAEVVLSVVPPSAAIAVAEQYVQAAEQCDRRAIFVDANAVSPQTAQRIASLLEGAGHRFLDASIHGLASRLPHNGTLYLSGSAAGEVARLFPGTLKIDVLGDEPGRASAMKMLVGGLNKGLVALLLEMSLLARQIGVLDKLLGVYRDCYPGVMEIVDRLLPTYPRHAGRRAEELEELENTMQSFGLVPRVVSGARSTIEEIGRMDFDECAMTARPGETAIPWLIETIHQQIYDRSSDKQEAPRNGQQTTIFGNAPWPRLSDSDRHTAS